MDDDRIWDHNAPGNDNTENTDLYRNRENFASPYAHYQFQQRTSAIREESSPKHRKKDTIWKKLPGTIALAAVFGLVAGAAFQCVNGIAGRHADTEQDVQTTEPLTVVQNASDTSAAGAGSASSNGSVASVAEAAMPAVVAITSVSIQEIPDLFGFYGFGGYGTRKYSSEGSGSGIIVGENEDELLIATNNHVVEGADTLSVCFIGNDAAAAAEETAESAGSESDINVEDAVTAVVKGTDVPNDLAVVAVNKSDIPADTLSQIKIAQIGDSDSLKVGEQVVAIGNALGYGQSVTSGWVSALDRSISTEDGVSSGLIQTDAAINPGNSGGALLNMNGDLIGINSAKYADNAVEGMGYAIPISTAQPILENLMNRQTREKLDASESGYLGVNLLDLSSEAAQMYNVPSGVLVSVVVDGEAAANAGIQPRDIIQKLDGQTISSKADLQDKIQYYAAGETVEMVIARAENGQYVEKTLEVTMGSRPEYRN